MLSRPPGVIKFVTAPQPMIPENLDPSEFGEFATSADAQDMLAQVTALAGDDGEPATGVTMIQAEMGNYFSQTPDDGVARWFIKGSIRLKFTDTDGFEKMDTCSINEVAGRLHDRKTNPDPGIDHTSNTKLSARRIGPGMAQLYWG